MWRARCEGRELIKRRRYRLPIAEQHSGCIHFLVYSSRSEVMSIGRNHFMFIRITANAQPLASPAHQPKHQQWTTGLRPHIMTQKPCWPIRIPVSRYLWSFVVLFWLFSATTKRLASMQAAGAAPTAKPASGKPSTRFGRLLVAAAVAGFAPIQQTGALVWWWWWCGGLAHAHRSS